MTHDDWSKIKNFTSKENWGDPDKMAFTLVSLLDEFRSFIGTPILVTRGTNGVHVEGSQHKFGRAVDIMFPELKVEDLFQCYLSAERFNFTGIGIYPHWVLHGEKKGGLHLDIRPSVDRAQSRWMGVLDDQGKQIYIGLNATNLKKYGLL